MQRNGSIEFFRCLLMFLIVFGHSCYYGVLPWTNCYWLVAFILTIRWHVDSFVAISGWFGIKFSWCKVLRLIGIMAFYSMASWLWCGRIDDVNGGWFGGTYLMLMFMAPLINAGVECLMEKSFSIAWSAWLAFAIGMTLNWLPRHAFSGCSPSGGTSHSLLTILFVYVTVRMVSLAKSPALEQRIMRFGIPFAISVVIICTGVHLVSYMCGTQLTWNNVKWITDYNSPATWSIAVMLILFFARKVRIPVCIEKTAAFLAPSMFGVYLLHETTAFGHEIFRVPQSWMVAHSHLPQFMVVLLSAILTFIVCVAIDMLRRLFVYFVRRHLQFDHSILNF